MFPLSSSSISFLLTVSVIQCSASERFDAKKEIEVHSNCNGEPIIVPPDLAAGLILAATNCLDIDDRYCGELCMAYHYKGFVKRNKLDTREIRAEGRGVMVGPKNEQAKADMLDALDKCAAPLSAFEKPTPRIESCPEAKQFMECIEENYQVSCKGKKPKKDKEAFLQE